MRDCKATVSHNRYQRGVALIMALMLLLLLTALAAALVFVANLETSVNANYRREQVLYFAAKAGIEEARDRLMATNPNTLIVTATVPTCTPAANHDCLPATPVVPSAANGGVFYIRGGATPTAVTPWTSATAYTDDELCHDQYALPGQTAEPADLRCIDEPTGTTWYKTTTSTIPWNTTATALPYQWVRLSWKLNGSVDNNLNSRRVNTAGAATTPVCWDGSEEILLSGAATCTAMTPPRSPVYLVTSLAVDPTTNARRMMQAELALPPSNPFIYGLYATSSACNALYMHGGATTDSYNSSVASYASQHTTTGGDVGSNGGVLLDGTPTQIGGSVGIAPSPNTCTVTGTGGLMAPSPPNAMLTLPSALTFPTPRTPTGVPTTNYTPPTPAGCATAWCMVPGTYGNISLSGANKQLTLAPGIYNINSISIASNNAGIVVNPPGAVVLNIAGQGGGTVVDLSGNGVVNPPVPPATTSNANNFQINYGGTGTINLTGGSQAYMVVNAPNAAITMQGGGDFYGSVIGGTIDDGGGFVFHYDRSLIPASTSTGSYAEISFRDVMY